MVIFYVTWLLDAQDYFSELWDDALCPGYEFFISMQSSLDCPLLLDLQLAYRLALHIVNTAQAYKCGEWTEHDP